MSREANPTAIGLFMLGAVMVLILGVTALASTAWFGDRHTFISFFDESVNGLERGAPVKFQGVPVGTVTELLVRIDQSDKTFRVPVQYEIDLRRLTTETGAFLHLDDAGEFRRQVNDGLRAQLQMESLVTGQLYVELTYRPEATPPRLEETSLHPEIPTTPSLLAAFGTDAGTLVADVLQILLRVNEMLEEVDMKEINTAVVASAQAVERLVGSEKLAEVVDGAPATAAQLARTLEELERLAQRVNGSIDPMQAGLEAALQETTRTLRSTRAAVEETRGAFTADSGLGYDLEQALISLRQAADAFRLLSLSLERHPDMLIRGLRPPGR